MTTEALGGRPPQHDGNREQPRGHMTGRRRVSFVFLIGAVLCTGILARAVPSARQPSGDQAVAGAPAPEGQSATQLPDGRWLLIGGQGPNGMLATGAIVDPATGSTTPLNGVLAVARAGHTATVLPDGSVLIAGGRNGADMVPTAELFDPATTTFMPLPMIGSVSRAGHTATLLTDGRVLISGGSAGGAALAPTEVWDLQTQTAASFGGGGIDRTGHVARLLPDGRVLISDGHRLKDASPVRPVIIDPVTGGVVSGAGLTATDAAPFVSASSPSTGASDVALDTRIVVRFSDALRVETLNTTTVRLDGPHGVMATKVVGAEHGRLAFVWPLDPLVDGETYLLSVDGAINAGGVPVVPASISFTTLSRPAMSDSSDSEAWTPAASNAKDGWRSGREPSPW